MKLVLHISVYLLLVLFLVQPTICSAQQRMSLNSLLDSIEQNHPISRMYMADIRSMDEAAKGARTWMPPELAAGFFMTPYSSKLWKKESDMEPGMGSIMISVQQMIPNKGKLDADEAYMKSMSATAKEQYKTLLNELFAQAKKIFYEWKIIERKKAIVEENQRVLEFMIRNAEIRYKNGLDKISAYYKAKAALEKVQNMRLMLNNESQQRKIILNTLMNRNSNVDFTIDTVITLKDHNAYTFESNTLINDRSDIKAIEREVLTNQLKIEAERKNLKPQFGIRFEHMFPFGAQPQQFSLMAMIRLPMVPWASRMTKASIESYRWRTEALNSQREMILNEARGMVRGMVAEIETVSHQLKLYENNVIPALRNYYKTMLLAYEQNTEELFMLFDAWESLNMTQLDYLDRLQELLRTHVELDRILQIR